MLLCYVIFIYMLKYIRGRGRAGAGRRVKTVSLSYDIFTYMLISEEGAGRRVRKLGRVGYDSAESYPTRPPPVQLGGPSQRSIAESPESGPSRTRSGSTRRSTRDSGLRVIPEAAESDTTRPSRIRLGRSFDPC